MPVEPSMCLSDWKDGPTPVAQVWDLAPETQSVTDFCDRSFPGTVACFLPQTGAAPEAPVMTGWAQQALNAAINLHHGDGERARCVCVTADMLLQTRWRCLWVYSTHMFVQHSPTQSHVCENMCSLWSLKKEKHLWWLMIFIQPGQTRFPKLESVPE